MNASGETSAAELRRDLGFFAVLTTATGTMIGAGIFILPGIAAANAGPAAMLSFLLAGLIAGMATFSAAELATAMPKAGGSYFFISRSMGPMVGTIVGLGAWLGLIFKGSFALVGLGQYIRFFSPVPVVATAALGGLLLTLVNWLGARASGTLQNVVVVALLAIMGGFVGKGLFAIQEELLTPYFHFGWSGVLATTGLVFISYLGIVKAVALSEEVRDPARNIPWGLLTSVFLVTVLYVLIMLIVTGVLPIEAGPGHPGIIDREAPLADAAATFLGGVGGAIVGVSGILATISTGNAAVLSSARFPFAMARDGLMAPSLQRISGRFRTPGRAIWLSGLIMVGLVFFLDVEQLAKLGGTFGILVFALLNVAVLILRRAAPPWYDPPFRSPLYPVLQIVGAVGALALIPQMGTLSQVTALIFILVGIVWHAWQQRVGEPVEPAYSVTDQFRRMAQQRSLEQKRRAREERVTTPAEVADRPRILLELLAGAPTRNVLTIAAGLARRHGASVDVVVPTVVPHQIPLSRHGAVIDREWIEKVEGRLTEFEVECEFHHVISRSRERAILGMVDERTELVIVDWHAPLRVHRLRASHVDIILREARTRVLVLKHRGPLRLNDVVVATGGGPYERAEVEVADAIAACSGATLTFLKILPTEAPEERERNAAEYLDGLRKLVDAAAQGRIVRDDELTAGLIRASRGADLLVIGATRQPRFRRTVFGRLPDRVAAGADVSVLIVREAEARRGWRDAIVARLFRAS